MGKKKFIDKKKSATFVLMHRDTEGADDDVAARVFTRLDGGYTHVPGFSEEDPRTNPDYGYETDDGEDDGGAFEESSVFADADEEESGVEHDVQSRRSRSTRRSVLRSAQKGPIPEHVRVELLELGFPDDGYDYMQHMRKIGGSGVGGSFVPTSRVQPDRLRADVKVYDSSKVAVQLAEEVNDQKIIEAVGLSTRSLRRPAYVENGLDPEVAAALADSEGSEFDSADELEDDFIVFANNNPEGSTSQEFSAPDNATLKNRNFKLETSLLEEDEDDHEFSDEDEDTRSVVTTENNRPRSSRLLDEQFEMLALREYDDDDDEFDEEDPEARGHADISQFDDVLSEFLTDPKVFGDKYMTPAEMNGKKAASTSVSKPVENGRDSGTLGVSKEEDSASARINESRSTDRIVEGRSQVETVEGDAFSDDSEDDELVIVEVESEDECSNWDCETVVSTLSNLDNHPGKIPAPGKPRHKQPTLEKVLEDKEVSGGTIKLRGKQHLPTDFLPVRPGAEKAKKEKNLGKALDSATKPKAATRAGETPEERKARKAAVKEERRDARAAKKALKIRYKDESQRAQHGAAHTGPSGMHLP